MPLQIHTILCRPNTMDNYAYLIIDSDTKQSAIIDASESAPIIKKCKELGITPDYIISTHHHFDHTDGNIELKKLYNCKVVGLDERIPELDIRLKDNETFKLGLSKAQIIQVKGHTQGHILLYFPPLFPSPLRGKTAQISPSPLRGEGQGGGDNIHPILFTGDTLFNLCVGGLFEGTEEQMEESLNKIKSLPNETLFYPGHEYTIMAARDALHQFPHNQELIEYIKRAKQRLDQGLPVHPVSLGIEKLCNPYLIDL